MFDRYAASTRENATQSVASLAALCQRVVAALDAALAADPNFLLGAWLHDAARWGDGDGDSSNDSSSNNNNNNNGGGGGDTGDSSSSSSSARSHAALQQQLKQQQQQRQQENNYLFNARNQITLWGPHGEINGYASKDWAGMLSGYYGPRWALLFDAMVASAAAGGKPIDSGAVNAAIYAFEQAWCAGNGNGNGNGNGSSASLLSLPLPSPYASGQDPVTLAQATLAAFAPARAPDPAVWRALPNTDVALPARTNASFVQVGGPDTAAVGADCPYMGQDDSVATLAACEQLCRAAPQCNVVNFNAGATACVYRLCADPRHPQVSSNGGWVVYGMNESAASPLLAALQHTDTGVLASLCDWPDSGCAGFTSHGFLLAGEISHAQTVPAPGVTLWLRA